MGSNDIFDQLTFWNDTYRKYPTDICLHTLFEKQVTLTPGATALVCGDEQLTYGELNSRANYIARLLIEQGVGPDSIVGICIERSIEMVVGLLAILKAGGAYLPLDPEYPKERIDFILHDAALSCILTSSNCNHCVASSSAWVLCLDEIEMWADDALTIKDVGVHAENLAYVIYTSGSTGVPKGALIEHKAIVNRILWMQEQFTLTEHDRVLQKTPYSFDVSVWEFFWPLTSGGQLIMAKPGGQKDADYLLDTILKNNITIIHFVPSMLRLFLSARGLHRAASLRLVIASGEALSRDLEKLFFLNCKAALFNLYGPTEAAVDVSFWECQKDSHLVTVPIGKPIANIQLFILNEKIEPVEVGELGELYIGGVGLARGYLNRPELTDAKFIVNVFKNGQRYRLYKTGDTCRYMPDGAIEYVGRADFQVKIRGFRVELGEIEAAIKQSAAVKDCVVIAREDIPGDMRIVAYVVAEKAGFSSKDLLERLQKKLPDYMVPAACVEMESFPLSANGKLDRKALPKPGRKRPHLRENYCGAQTTLEKQFEAVWCRVLGYDGIGIHDNFYDLGGNSFLAIQVVTSLNDEYGIQIPLIKMFELPTIALLAANYSNKDKVIGTSMDIAQDNESVATSHGIEDDSLQNAIAIIGMSGRFPGASDLDVFWENLCNGVESVKQFSRQELIDAGIAPAVLDNPKYIASAPVIDNADCFDAAFFGYNPEDAAAMDPQHRLFLECCWSSIENAGYNPEEYTGKIGVFGGCSMNFYFLKNVLPKKGLHQPLESFIAMIGNEKDYLTTKVSYCLNLTGPSINVQTGCSTALVGVHLACQSLLNYDCDMALAGGATVRVPQKEGYVYTEGLIASKDGHCRTFDENASGTIFGEGVGVVLLKRYHDAVKDKDPIDAVILGTAINNDGSLKVGYTAPSVNGQKDVIESAYAMANVEAKDISYIEAHGTGTLLGDPIEVKALAEVFGASAHKHCALGSLKPNIGHLDAAAGIAGLIKTVLVLKHRKVPPIINLTNVNPKLELEKTPFYINKECIDLVPSPLSARPERLLAGVSSFGVGGTNAHALLQAENSSSSSVVNSDTGMYILPCSAKTPGSLQGSLAKLGMFFMSNSTIPIVDCAYTLLRGRKQFPYRDVVVANSTKDAAEQLEKVSSHHNSTKVLSHPSVTFMFTGQGSQYVNMGKKLYDNEPLFKQHIHECARLINKFMGIDIVSHMFTEGEPSKEMSEYLKRTEVTQPALFAIEYSLAQVLIAWGIKPDRLIGHSVGEYVAATIAGVFTLDQATEIICMRGQLMQSMPEGAMLAVSLPAEEAAAYCTTTIGLAVVNSPEHSVLAGPTDAVRGLSDKLKALKIQATILKTSHAFHSSMMGSAAETFVNRLASMRFNKPLLPLLSNVTGDYITDVDAVSAQYWGNHIRNTVLFSDGIKKILENENQIMVEVGPGNTLCSLVKMQEINTDAFFITPSLPAFNVADDAHEYFLWSVGQIWAHGGKVAWDNIADVNVGRRLHLPTYSFEKTRYWIEPVQVKENLQNKTEDKSTVQENCGSTEISLYETIAAIWRNTLGVASVNSGDDFYDLGGNSLNLTRVFARVSALTNNKVTLQDLIKTTILKDLVELIERHRVPVEVAPVLIPVLPRTGVLPLSASQERLWFISKMDPENIAYNLVHGLEIRGTINVEYLVKSWERVCLRHEILNTVFRETDAGPIVEVVYNTGNVVNVVDFSAEADGANAAEARILEEARIPFDIASGPLFKVLLCLITNDKSYFVLFVHHAVCDGWSMSIWVEELVRCYKAYISGTDPYLPELPFQFADYAAWQKTVALQHLDNKYREFWVGMLGQTPPVLQLPTDYRRPVIPKNQGKCIPFSLSVEQTQKILQLSRKKRTTAFQVLLSMFFTLLYRYSNQERIIIGCPNANRSAHSDLEKLIGFFINMVPYKADLHEGLSFNELLQEIKGYSEKIGPFQDISFAKMVEMINPPRVTNHTPVFQAMFAYQNYPYTIDNVQDVTFKRRFFNRGASEYDLSLYLGEEGPQITGVFEFSTELFAKATIDMMSKVFYVIIDSILEDSNRRLNEIPLLPPNMRGHFFAEKQKTFVEYDKNKTFVRHFEETVSRFSKKKAVVCGSQSLTYSELNAKSNSLGSFLRKKGVGPDALVGIMVDRSIEMVVSQLGVFKSGAAYVPLDPSFPKERLTYMIQDSNLRMLITQSGVHADVTVPSDVLVIEIDKEWAVIAKESTSNVTSVNFEEHLAYVIYTSGSTGKPKGVAITNQALINFLLSMKKVPGIYPDDKLLAVTTISFDISGLEIFGTLMCGALLVIAESYAVTNGEKMMALLNKHSITIMQATPVTWKMLLDSSWCDTPHLRVLCGGEALSRDLADRMLATKSEVWNMFGPTETTIWSSVGRVVAGSADPDIGLPIDNTWFMILNKNNNQQPDGLYGELAIGGDGLAREYLHRSELTRERFIEHEVGGRLYKTGDLARKCVDGTFEYCGRLDFQVKINGFRIELGEIENVLKEHPAIKDVVVTVIDDQNNNKQLVAFIIAEEKFDSDRIRAFCGKKLPYYMIPQFYQAIDDFPLTSNGKVDRKSLQEQSIQAKKGKTIVNPESNTEIALIEIWKQFFGIDTVSVEDNYFELGGTSILAVKLFSQIEKHFGVVLPLATLFSAPSIRDIAKLLDEKKLSTNSWSLVVPIRSKGSKKPLFLIHGGGGNVLLYRELAMCLPKDQPVYGVQAQGLNGKDAILTSIEEMAERYIKEIMQVDPEGPYYLGGYCLGGTIIYEMAQRLTAAGKDVALVAMFDTYREWFELTRTERLRFLVDNIGFHVKNIAQASPRGKVDFIKERSLEAVRRVNRKMAVVTSQVLHSAGVRKDPPLIIMETVNDAAAMKYIAKPYSGKITVFKPKSVSDIVDPYLGWKSVETGGVDLVNLSAYRNGILIRPFVVEMAFELSKRLEQ